MDALPATVAFVPLMGAAILGGLSGKAKRWIMDVLLLAFAGGTFALAVALLVRADHQRLIHWFGGWAPRHGIALGVAFTVDQIGAAAAVMVSGIALMGAVYSWRYLEPGENHFHVLLLLFDGGMIGFALSGDLFIMFVFFELMSIAAYALTGLKIGETGPLQGAINFAVVNSVGSFAFLLGVGLLYGRTGALNFAQVGQALSSRGTGPIVVVGMTLILAGLFVKAAVVPFHFWLADAHAVAPTPVCMLFSGIMVELGLYGAARIYWSVFRPAVGGAQHDVGLVLVGGGVLSILVGSVMCFAQQHLKRLLAFSTIAHAGIALVGIGLMSHEGLAGSAVYIAGHGMVKASLFALAGVLLHRTGVIDERALRGRGRGLPLAGVLFALGGLGLAGLPPFGTETGKSLIEEAARHSPWLPWLFGLAEALTGGAVLRLAGKTFLGLGPKRPDRFESEESGAAEETRETIGAFDRTPWVLVAPACLLLAAGAAVGLLPHLAEHAQVAAARFQDPVAYRAFVLGARDSLGAPTAHPLSSIGAWYGVAAAAGAVGLAGLALFRDRLSSGMRDLFRPALRPVLVLRRAHTGHVGDYVMWFTVGLAALGGLLVLAAR